MHEGSQSFADLFSMLCRDHATEYLVKARGFYARNDVLQTIGLQHACAQALDLSGCKRTLAIGDKVIDISRCLRLKNAIDRSNEANQIDHRQVSFLGTEFVVFAMPFQLVHD